MLRASIRPGQSPWDPITRAPDGTFPRILGKFVRDEGVIPLEDAIRKMSSAVAS